MFQPVAEFVDDEPRILSTIRRSLRGQPVQVRTYTDVGEALAVPGSADADLNGIEFLTRTAELHPNPSRVFLTGNTDFQTAIEAINRGAVSRFLTKPWKDGEFADTILEQAATSTLDRLLAALPSFQTRTLALRDPSAVVDPLGSFVHATAGLEIGIEIVSEPHSADYVAVETVTVAAGGSTVVLENVQRAQHIP